MSYYEKKDYEKLLEDVKKVKELIEKADYVKHAYFWTGDNGNRSAREYRCRQLSGSAEWEEGGVSYYGSVDVTQSRNNTYVHSYYYKDEKRTNLKAVRYSYNRMKAILDTETAKREKREKKKKDNDK